MPLWSFADVGFDTGRLFWVFQFSDAHGDGSGNLPAHAIELRDATTFQYWWADQGRFPDGSPNPNVRSPMFHVRQRILREYVENWSMDGETLVVQCKRGIEPDHEAPFPLPAGVVAVEMAYHLGTSKGFVELVDKDGKAQLLLDDRWVITENLTMHTVGTYPRIRLRAAAEDVHGLVITGTTCTVVGRRKG